MAANADVFRDEPKVLTAKDRTEALLAAYMNDSRIEEFPNLEPGVRKLLEMNSELFRRLAS